MTSNDPFNNEFGNSLRDSILDKRLKDLKKRVEQLEIDAQTVQELVQRVDEIENILHNHIEDKSIHFTVSAIENDDGEDCFTLTFSEPPQPDDNNNNNLIEDGD